MWFDDKNHYIYTYLTQFQKMLEQKFHDQISALFNYTYF